MQRREYIDQRWWLHLNPLRVLLADCFMWRGRTYLLQKNISKMLMLVCVPAAGTKLEWQTIHTQCRSLKQDCHKEFTSAARKLAMSTRKLKKKIKEQVRTQRVSKGNPWWGNICGARLCTVGVALRLCIKLCDTRCQNIWDRPRQKITDAL